MIRISKYDFILVTMKSTTIVISKISLEFLILFSLLNLPTSIFKASSKLPVLSFFVAANVFVSSFSLHS